MKIENEREVPEVLSYKTIRRAIGFLGVLLPVVLLASGFFSPCDFMMPSISHYYFTYMATVFTGTLCAVGLFLITYKGFGKVDDGATNFAGACAFGVALFPTSKPENSCNIYVDAFWLPPSYIHYTFASLFFITLAAISIFLFTQKGEASKVTARKLVRNNIYKTCGYLMLIFCALVPIATNIPTLEAYNTTFWLEALALWSFGVSWLTKGALIQRDQVKGKPA